MLDYRNAINESLASRDLTHALCLMAKWEHNDAIKNGRDADFDAVFKDTKDAFYDYNEENPSFFGLPMDLIS